MDLRYDAPVEAKVHHRTQRQVWATWDSVVIRICDGEVTTPEDIERLRGLFDEILASSPTAGVLMVFHHGAPIPDTTTRAAAVRMLDDFGDRVALSIALLGLGFWAQTLRSVIATVVSTLRGIPVRVSPTVEEAAQALAMELIGVDPQGLCSAHDQLWAELQHGALSVKAS